MPEILLKIATFMVGGYVHFHSTIMNIGSLYKLKCNSWYINDKLSRKKKYK